MTLTSKFTTLGAAALVATTGLVAPAFAEDVTIDLWSRADRSGPLRPGNIVAAAEQLNRAFEAAGSDTRVVVNLIETNAKGFDADALNLLKAHSVGETPDIIVAAHEWIGSFVEAGLAANLEGHIAANEAMYADIIPNLWNSVMYKGERYGIPQDSEVRMFFVNNDILRSAGKDEAFIAALPGKVEAGEFTMYDWCDLAAEAVESGAAKYGWVHRPNVGPDFQMAMASFGIDIYNEDEAKLQITKSGLENYYDWLGYCVNNGSLPADMTTWTWDSTHAAFRGGESMGKFHGIWNVGKQLDAFGLDGKEAYFDKLTWIHAPAGEKGGQPKNLSHPIVYVVGDTENKELAALLVAMASQHVPNTAHAVGTNHTPINYGQIAMPEFQEKGWALIAGTPMLKYAEFMPNHAKIGQYNAITYTGVQAVETGEMTPAEATEMVIEELEIELGDDVIILD
ncbi:extracellular solute-binding protein [Epibacterium sp. SM1979]|uniref:Extracellular solute-binding protein n=1 Tax=Tritonibacter litoralis TaxID=2662264 RepID=A0A843YCB4_9RHOB|nr:extracellular solute-binding protein [Tritonibacter litoralis]MQQ07528.1 extracellular solute-binding protein [Tritonibacter litoralis]